MYVLSRSYVGRVPENLKKTITFWISNLHVLMAFSFLSLWRRALCFLFEVPVLSRSLLNGTDLISFTHVVGLLVVLLVVWVNFGRFNMISTGRSHETWSHRFSWEFSSHKGNSRENLNLAKTTWERLRPNSTFPPVSGCNYIGIGNIFFPPLVDNMETTCTLLCIDKYIHHCPKQFIALLRISILHEKQHMVT